MYTVFVASHAHYQDDKETYELGRYQSYPKAVRKAQRIVDRSLRECAKWNMSADQIFEAYMMWGDDPYIIPSAEPEFSARDYAKSRAHAYTGLRAWLPW